MSRQEQNNRKKHLYSIADTKANIFFPPFLQDNNAVAIRSFTEAVNGSGTNVSKYPEDFILYEVGHFDEETGIIEAFEVPHAVVRGTNVLINNGDLNNALSNDQPVQSTLSEDKPVGI